MKSINDNYEKNKLAKNRRLKIIDSYNNIMNQSYLNNSLMKLEDQSHFIKIKNDFNLFIKKTFEINNSTIFAYEKGIINFNEDYSKIIICVLFIGVIIILLILWQKKFKAAKNNNNLRTSGMKYH